MAADRSIRIKWAASHYVFGCDDGVRVRFDVVCAENMDTKVFAYRMLPLSPETGAAEGHFSHICSPPDLEEYPEDGPTPGFSPEWFRLSYVDVLVRSVQEAEDFVEIVRADIRRIHATLCTMDTLIPGGEELIGDIECEPEPLLSSSSASQSSSSLSLTGVKTVEAWGTNEQSVGAGVSWENIGLGAGTPVGSSDSMALNRSRVKLCAGESSQVLLVQGFDFSDLPDDAVIEGIIARTTLRDASDDSLGSMSSESSESGAASLCPRLLFLTLQHPTLGLGTDKALNECIGGPNFETLTHGGAEDLWGFGEVTPDHLKSGDFGLSLVVGNDFDTLMSAVEVDGVEIEVYYREPG